MQAASVPDLFPKTAKYIESSEPAASVAFPFSTYEAVFNDEIEDLVVPDTITVVRKKKEKTLAVRDFLTDSVVRDGNKVTFTLESKPSGSLRPDKLLEEIGKQSRSVSGAPLEIITTTRTAQRA